MKNLLLLACLCCIVPAGVVAQKKPAPQKPTPKQMLKPAPPLFTIAKLQQHINTIATTDTDLTHATWSVYAIDTKTNEILLAHNPLMVLTPASTQKIITTATAIEILGANTRFETQLAYNGTLKNQVLTGNVYLVGKGDPCLGSHQELIEKHYYPAADSSFLNTWVDAIKKQGINKIQGRIIANDAYFDSEQIPNTWAWGDIGNYYGAYASGLCIFDNNYTITLKTPDLTGANTQILRIKPPMPQLKITNKSIATTTTTDQTNLYNTPLSYTPTLRGELPKAKENFDVKGSLPNPAQTAAETLHQALEKQGIIISNPPTTTRNYTENSIAPLRSFYNYPSPTVATIAQVTNYKSINLYAEMLLLHIGATQAKTTTDQSAEIMKNYWQTQGINTKGLQIYDGSGLSAYNAMHTKFLVEVLDYMKSSPNFNYFYNTLPVGGQSGTVKSMFKNTILENKIRLKSGSISNVRAYAGYLSTLSDRNVAFAIIINNYTCTDTEARRKMEKIMLKIAEVQN